MLTAKNIYYNYKGKAVLNDVSLDLSNGVYGLLGPNGSGKTTLLRCIAGIIIPQKGTIERPERIGYLPQSFGMYPELTVYEALRYFAIIKGISDVMCDEIVMSSIELTNLEKQKDEKIGRLSGGMVRRVGIAQAIIGEPGLIIVDEPTTGLDPEERMRFKNLIARIRGTQTIVIATHIVDDVESLCNQIILLKNGRIVCQEKTESLRDAADGFVYSVPWQERGSLTEPFTIMQDETANGQGFLRVLAPNQQPGIQISPTLEDGYMFIVKGYHEITNN